MSRDRLAQMKVRTHRCRCREYNSTDCCVCRRSETAHAVTGLALGSSREEREWERGQAAQRDSHLSSSPRRPACSRAATGELAFLPFSSGRLISPLGRSISRAAMDTQVLRYRLSCAEYVISHYVCRRLPSEPTMYPQNGQSPPQSGRAAGQQQYQDPAYQPQGYQSQPPMTQTQGYGAAVLSPQMQPGQGGMGMQPGQGGVGDGYEMQGVAPGNGYANAEPSLGPGSSMQQFFAEVCLHGKSKGSQGLRWADLAILFRSKI